MKYGQRYRELRKKQGISLIKASEGIVSEPTLSRWETGKGPMDFEMVPKLLERINCTIEDFFPLKENIIGTDKLKIEIIQLFRSKNDVRLCQLTKNLIVTLHRHPNHYDYLVTTVMSCNYYQKLSGENLLLDSDIERLSVKLLKMKINTQNNLQLLELALPLISISTVFEIALNIRKSIVELDDKNTLIVHKMSEIYLKIILNFIKENECYLAHILLLNSETCDWLEYYEDLKIQEEFCKDLLNYKITNNKADIDKFLSIL